MKAMIVAEKERVKDFYSFHLEPRGFNIIVYSNPIKAMDNLDEIDPDLVLFSATDFPRHWKIFLKLYQELERFTMGVFILLKDNDFDEDEMDKAKFLSVNGILNEMFEDPAELNDLEDILSLNNMIHDDRNSPRYVPSLNDDIGFLFTHPDTYKLVSGKVLDISIYGIAFKPDNPDLTENLLLEQEIDFATLSLDDNLMSIRCVVKRNMKLLGFSFVHDKEDTKRAIQEFIRTCSRRRLTEKLEGTFLG